MRLSTATKPKENRVNLPEYKTMSHNHGQDCGHEHHDHDHDHDHDHAGGPPANNLYGRIDRQNVAALNAEEGADPCVVFKPWHERLDETKVSQTYSRAYIFNQAGV